jgi:sarcosine oxidase, subunit gamma
MASQPDTHARSALSHAAQCSVSCEEQSLLSYVNLRGRIDDGLIAAIASGCGIALPTRPNTISNDGGITAYWLGPDEWLLVSAEHSAESMVAKARQGTQGLHAAVTDVSSGYTSVILRGRGTRSVLARGCSLDLHPSVFGSGQCAQTLVAKCPVLLAIEGDGSDIRVIVRRSFSDYLWSWLHDVLRTLP